MCKSNVVIVHYGLIDEAFIQDKTNEGEAYQDNHIKIKKEEKGKGKRVLLLKK